jgi:PAS domain S-box-containing protein
MSDASGGARAERRLPVDVAHVVVERAPDAVFVTTSDFALEWVNEAAAKLLGFPAEALIGKRIEELLVDPDDLAREPLRRAALLSGEVTTTTRTFRTGDGGARVLEVCARAIDGGRLLGIARDATERMKAQEALARSEASFRALIEASPDGILVHRDAKILYANAALSRILGWPDPSAMIGTSAAEIVHPDDRKVALERIGRLVAGEANVPFVDERLLRADGRVVSVQISGVRIVFEGKPSVLAVIRDVGEQRRIQEQLAKADRMASLGTLAAGVAHEINNPLTYVLLHLDAIAGTARRLRRGIDRVLPILSERLGEGASRALFSPELTRETAELLAEHAANASEGAQRVARIVRDLRAFSRFDDDVREPIDVHRPIELATSTAAHELKHRAKVVRDYREVPPVVASEGRLAQIVLNLLLNAAHAIPEGHPDVNEIRIRTNAAEGEVQIAITDTGVGIPEEQMRRLFEPFFTTKPVGEGSGLGLAICHGLVTTLGGRILVESTPGEGSTFTVVLPAATEAARPKIVPATRERPVPSRRGRILVVDDEPAIGEAVGRALRARHDVVFVASAAEARAVLERDAAFDVILCDVVMPEETGADLHRWLTARDPALADRILFMSGGRVGEASRALAEIEPSRWLEKPFTAAALDARIEAALARAPRPGVP